MSAYTLRSARFLAAEAFEKYIHKGDTVVDATMGNGHDTLKLANLVGECGHVFAFDVQAKALQNTRERLEQAELLLRVTLICDSHENMTAHVKAPVHAVVFNLGWLPGGDKTITTHLSSTLAAVHSALKLLTPMGMLILCVYPGHPEGMREKEALKALFTALPAQEYNCLEQRFLNAGEGAPECFLVQKQAID